MRLLAAFALGVLGVAVSTGTPIVQGNTMSSAAAVPCAGVQTLHSTAGCSMQYGSNAVMPGQNTAFSLQAQAGNRSLTSTDELRILDTSGVSAITSASGDLAWTNGTAFSFQISYDAATRALSYTVNGTTLVANLAAAALITDVLIQTQATSVGSIMTISDLVVNGVNLPGSMSQASQANAGRQVDYLWISGLHHERTDRAVLVPDGAHGYRCGGEPAFRRCESPGCVCVVRGGPGSRTQDLRTVRRGAGGSGMLAR
jgi:hypothetical protein